MEFEDSRLNSALASWRREAAADRRAEGDNMTFEQRIAEPRRTFFENFALEEIGTKNLSQRQIDYVKEFVRVPGVPHTFQRAFGPPAREPIEPAQAIIRLESIERHLANQALTFEKLQSAHDGGEHALVDDFLQKWNLLRDAWPSFVAFKEELTDELAQDNWPCLLRDRLGLAHYDAKGGPVAVALMEYTVEDVLAEVGDPSATAAFTVPTVLDSGPWPWFFPAPATLDYGRAMPLAPIDSDDLLLAEALHCRLTYRRHHLKRLGHIRTPTPDLDIRALRNHHLIALRLAAGDDNFGDEMT